MNYQRNKLPLVENKGNKNSQTNQEGWQEGYVQDGRHVSELSTTELDELVEKVKDWRFSQSLLHKQVTILQHALEELAKRDDAYYLELERSFQDYLLEIIRKAAPFLSVETGRKAQQVLLDALLEKANTEVAHIEKLNKSNHD